MNDQTFDPTKLDKWELESALENIVRIIKTSRYPPDSGIARQYRLQHLEIVDQLKLRNRASDNK